jgi:hypothetical protein
MKASACDHSKTSREETNNRREDLIVNQFQESLLTSNRTGLPMRLVFVQAAIGFAFVLMISALGLFAASHAIGQEVSGVAEKGAAPVATANVLPKLVILPESLEPNLNGMLATGDGGAMIEIKEITSNLPQASTALSQARK